MTRFSVEIAGWDEQTQTLDESHIHLDNEEDYRQLLQTLNAVLEAFVKQKYPGLLEYGLKETGGPAREWEEQKQ